MSIKCIKLGVTYKNQIKQQTNKLFQPIYLYGFRTLQTIFPFSKILNNLNSCFTAVPFQSSFTTFAKALFHRNWQEKCTHVKKKTEADIASWKSYSVLILVQNSIGNAPIILINADALVFPFELSK